MDEVLDRLKGRGFGSLPGGFREHAYASVGRGLRHRRWARRGRVALVVSAMVCLVWMASIVVPNFVRRQYLTRLPLDELIAMHRESVAGPLVEVSYAAPPLPQVVEQSDVLVWGKVVEVTPNREDVERGIVEAKGATRKVKQMVNEILGREVFVPIGDDNIRVSLGLEVYKSYPALGVGEIKKGREGIFAIRRLARGRNQPYEVSVEHGSIYLIDKANSVVSGVPSAGDGRPVEQAWEFMCDLYDSIHGDEQLKAAALSKELRLLVSSNQLDECYAALLLLEWSPEAVVKADDVMGAIERFYGCVKPGRARQGVVAACRSETYLGFVALGLKAIGKVGDEDSAERIWVLYVEDMGSESPVFKNESYSIFEKVVRLAVKFPGPDRRRQLEKAFKARSDTEYEQISTWQELQKKNLIRPVHSAVRVLAQAYDEDIEGLLLEMCHDPRRFGIYDSRTLGVVWESLSNRGNEEIGPLLQQFVSAPEETELGVVYYPSLKAAADRAQAILGK